jgi:hypothetical protein
MTHLRLAVLFGALLCCSAAAQTIPTPCPRPAAVAPPAAEEPSPGADTDASACRLRLTGDLAVASSVAPIAGPGECGGDDLVQLEAVVLSNKSRVAILPPAMVRCTFAEAIVRWVREDLSETLRTLGTSLKSLDNYSSYNCRGRNNIAGAKLSEHGKANALDVRSLKLANGVVVSLTDPRESRSLRESLRKGACNRFTTVLGPGSDGYHEEHIHVDLAERRNGHRMCQWDVREPAEESIAEDRVPLPRPRPRRGHG